ncbi:Hypothetical protein HVR_LOCUS1041 [uncultured virus]|nr:Hypothetical protein HVR_LOCUS1041 [uncultured virus]
MTDTPASFSIMCFSWNASGLRLCETMSQTKANEARKGFAAFVTLKKPCLAPDFFEDIRGIIREKQPALIVMSTEDEDKSDTYFHSDLLPKSMPEIGYSLLKREQKYGIGELAAGVPQVKVPTGNPSGTALRMSIYARNDIFPGLKSEEKALNKLFGNDGQVSLVCPQGNRAAGAIASYVWSETFGKFVFIAVDFPSSLESLKVGKGLDYDSYRVAAKAANTICLVSLLNKFIDSLPAESKPDHIFILGDLGFDIVVPNKRNIEVVTELAANLSAAKLKELQKNDELTIAKNEAPLAGFKEGVSNEGPLFMPTWRLTRGRPDACVPDKDATKVDITCFGSTDDAVGGIGWHDRILYKESMTSHYMAHCLEYNRIDIKNMHASTHAGVTAFFEMRAIN